MRDDRRPQRGCASLSRETSTRVQRKMRVGDRLQGRGYRGQGRGEREEGRGNWGKMDMETKEILFEKSGHVAEITLNRPAKLNAYSEVMVHEIIAALENARDDDDIRAVIITGAG